MPVETQTTTERECVRCSAPLPEGTYWCPACGKLNTSPAIRVTFLLIIVGILAGIAFTGWYVAYLRGLQSDLAKRWFARGEQAMAKKYPETAVEYYRNALGYDGNNPGYRLRLAEALEASGHTKEARAYLLGLWSQEPANAQVNLDLARLYAEEKDTTHAVRYYRAAVDGVWGSNGLQRRMQTRLEFVQYLLDLGNKNNALAELIALQSEAPPDDVPFQLKIGQLLLQFGEYARAQNTFANLLKQHPDIAEAWKGAAQASMQLGDYREAEHMLDKAVRLTGAKPGSEEANQLATLREVLDLDPDLETLPLSQRAQRAARAFNYAMNRLTQCAQQQNVQLAPTATKPPQSSDLAGGGGSPAPVAAATAPGSLQLLYQSGIGRKATGNPGALRQNPDAIQSTMDFVYDVVRATEACPADSSQDRAFQLLARQDAQEQR